MRANYQCYIFRHYKESSAPPKSYPYGWHENEQGLTTSTMFIKNAVPERYGRNVQKSSRRQISKRRVKLK